VPYSRIKTRSPELVLLWAILFNETIPHTNDDNPFVRNFTGTIVHCPRPPYMTYTAGLVGRSEIEKILVSIRSENRKLDEFGRILSNMLVSFGGAWVPDFLERSGLYRHSE
jgi:hypothetical protein